MKYVYLYILINALEWIISVVSFEFTGGGSCNIRPPGSNDPVGIDLTPTPIPAAKQRILHTRQMTAEKTLKKTLHNKNIGIQIDLVYKLIPIFGHNILY